MVTQTSSCVYRQVRLVPTKPEVEITEAVRKGRLGFPLPLRPLVGRVMSGIGFR